MLYELCAKWPRPEWDDEIAETAVRAPIIRSWRLRHADQVMETTVINKEREPVVDVRWYGVAYLDVVCFL